MPDKKSILLLMFSIITSFLIIEIFLYIIEQRSYFKINTKSYIELFSDERDKSYVFAFEPNVQVKLRNTNDTKSIIAQTNNLGIRENQNYSKIEKALFS